MEMVQMATVRSNRETNRKLTLDGVVEEIANVLAIADARELGVLTTKAISTVECDGGDKPRLPRREAKEIQTPNAFLKCHPSRSM
jgi:hypothetical protein